MTRARLHWIGGTLSACAVALLAACSNPNLSGGKLHFDQQRFGTARSTFARAVEQMPESGEARLWLGKSYAELAMPDSASYWFDEAARVQPAMAKDVQDTRDHYWSVLHNSGITLAGGAQDKKNKGDEAGARPEFERALREFQRAIIYSPGRHETLTNIGKMYFNLEKVDSALMVFDQVHKLAPDDEPTNNLLTSVYQDQGNGAYTSAGAILGAPTPSHADSLKARQLYLQADELYRKAADINATDPDLRFQLAATAYELSFLDEAKRRDYLTTAVEEYAKVLEQNPNDIDVMYNRALVLRDLERYDEARTIASQLVDMKPNKGEYHELLGRISDKLGDKTALIRSLIFAKALRSKETVDPTTFSERAKAAGASSDMVRRGRESGPPDQIRIFRDSQGTEYETWWYWMRGTAFAFMGGDQKYDLHFAKQNAIPTE